MGIDEVGRGPLAGPVTVGIFVAEEGMRRELLKDLFHGNLRDSKKLSASARESINRSISLLKKEGRVFCNVAHISNKIIDKKGISFAINSAIKKLTKGPPQYTEGDPWLRLDGGLKGPEKFKNQKTIIKGDEKDVFIACASIVAKVSRDALMARLSKKYLEYGFEKHKGYGTKLHRKMIAKHGISDLHRASFCVNLAQW
jgi:ribonuclease HII